MGTYRKRLRGETAYASYIPTPLADITVEVSTLEGLLDETSGALERLNAAAAACNDEERQSAIHQEAEASWMLAAGKTFTPFGISFFVERWNDDEQTEINHLEQATRYAVEALQRLPICGRLLREAHYLMCRSARYEKRYPGEFRTSPVWIGEEGCSLREALFIPPTDEDMTEAFSDLERFINTPSEMHPLLRAALIHYQFETIHPFIDANGRVGRLLNTLFLLQTGALRQPVLAWSRALGRESGRYAAALQHVHSTGEVETWIRFYLLSVGEAAEQTVRDLATHASE